MTAQDAAQPSAATSSHDSTVSKEDSCDAKEKYPFTMLNGLKTYIIRGTKFQLPEKYVVTGRLGQGSYGMVVQALDKEKGCHIAIKKCGSLFKHPEDGKRILREIKLMQLLNHRNILSIMDVLAPTSRQFEEVYMVLPLLDTDLGSIIRSQPLSEGHCKYIVYQILRGAKYIHSANVLHRDLKPANILINFDCRIKICDFGLARGADPTRKQNLTSYVVTRWYRAPELLLDNTRYNSAIDIWSIGCIFAEMLRGTAVFPGESSLDQMHLVTDALGIPPDDDLWWIQSAKLREYLKARSGKENKVSVKDLRGLLPADIKPLAMDFVKHMLAFNPYKRWSADWLLDHPYLSDCHRPDSCIRATSSFKWKWDSEYPDAEALRDLFWQEMMTFHPEIEQLFPPVAAELNHTGTKSASTVEDLKAATRVDCAAKTTIARIEGPLRYIKAVEPKVTTATIRERPINVIRTDDRIADLKGPSETYPVVTERTNCRTILQECER